MSGMTVDSTPFEDIRHLVKTMPSPRQDPRDAVSQQLAAYVSDLSPFGHYGEALKWLAGWQGRTDPSIDRPLVTVFAGSHGVAGTVTGTDVVAGAQARVAALTKGGAAVRGMASAYGAAFKVYEMGIEYPSADMTREPSLSERDCAAAIAFGMEVVAEGADMIVLGNAGFGSASAAAAIAHGLFGGSADYWAGGNTTTAAARIEAVKTATDLHREHLSDPLDILRCFGGRDIAGMVGALIAARHQSIPVLLDGYVVCAAAAILHKISDGALAHCYAGHLSAEPAHGALLDRLGLKPLMDAGIGVGDGTGATLAMGSLMAAANGLRTSGG